ncbi:hypothetical protein [Armatimonas sp.]|uniref:hypothetical protein n=1 Tax=Armatimonas sp. TaxID=1872638 RepID=UPI003750ECAB
MNRRNLLGLMAPRFLAQAAPKRDLLLIEAPLRSVFELIFKGFGQSNYFLDNAVVGLATVTLRAQSFERTLGVVCQLVPQLLEWKQEEGITSIRAAPVKPEPSEDIMAIFQRARFPVIEGIPCRVAGCVLGGTAPVAILESGNPLRSEVQIVEQGQKLKLQGGRYLVERIHEDGIVLRGEDKVLKIPLAPLVPKPPKPKL